MKKIRRIIAFIPPKIQLFIKWLIFYIAIFILIVTVQELNYRYLSNSQQLSNFLTPWYSFRAFLIDGTSPYTEEMREGLANYANTNFAAIYSANDAELYLRTPLYGLVVFLPFLFVQDFMVAASWWMTFQLLCLVLIAIWGVSLIKQIRRRNFFYFAAGCVVILLAYPSFLAVTGGSSIAIAFLLLFAAMVAMKREADELAGVLLALMTMFPFWGWLTMLFLIMWSIRQKRLAMIGWFLGTVVLLGFAVALLEAGWLLSYLRMWFSFFGQHGFGLLPGVLDGILPSSFLLPQFVVGLVILILLVEWALAKFSEYTPFLWTFHLTLVLESLLTFWVKPINLVPLATTLLFLLIIWEDRRKSVGRWIGLFIIVLALAYPWLLNQLPEANDLFFVFPVAVFLVLNLYWVRWWLFRNVKLWYHEMYTLEHPGENYEL
jgi:hypothetical protein